METMEVTGVMDQVSKKGEPMKMITFRDVNGSARSYVVKTHNNYQNWKEVFESGVGTVVSNLEMKGERMVDADSKPIILESKVSEDDCKEVKAEIRAKLNLL